jgi:hypothetical protein
MSDDQQSDQPIDPEHVDGSPRNRTAGEDPGAYIGHEPERSTETIPGGIGRADERVSAVATQAGAETAGAGGEMPEGHRVGEPASEDRLREAGDRE